MERPESALRARRARSRPGASIAASSAGWPSDGSFLWATGIEDTCLGEPLRASGRTLDAYVLTQHDRFWREDLDRAASLGVQGLRYGLPWHRINPAPGCFAWEWADAVLEHATGRLGLRVILDLIHYGTPSWLRGSFVDPGYGDAVAAFAGAVAERYRGVVSAYTPHNEPIVTADLCGLRGTWPPYLEGERGWVAVTAGVVDGMRSAIAAIRSADPAASIVHVEASIFTVEGVDAGAGNAGDAGARRSAQLVEQVFLPTDLLLGRVEADGPSARWLLERGLPEKRLEEFAHPPHVDVLGVNYYPNISAREIRGGDGAEPTELRIDGWDTGLRAVLSGYHDRYRLPVMVTETSTIGDDARRLAWLEASVHAVAQLRERGVPIVGYTWWPLFDLVDWDYAAGDRASAVFLAQAEGPGAGRRFRHPAPVEDDDVVRHLAPMGAWALERAPDGTLLRRETPVAERLRALTHALPGAVRLTPPATMPPAWGWFTPVE